MQQVGLARSREASMSLSLGCYLVIISAQAELSLPSLPLLVSSFGV